MTPHEEQVILALGLLVQSDFLLRNIDITHFLLESDTGGKYVSDKKRRKALQSDIQDASELYDRNVKALKRLPYSVVQEATKMRKDDKTWLSGGFPTETVDWGENMKKLKEDSLKLAQILEILEDD